MVSSLVDKGLITREPDPTNRRAVIIQLTPEGDRLYLEVLTNLQRRLAHDLADLTAQQRADLVSALELLGEVMSRVGEIRQHLPLPLTMEPENAPS